MSYRPEREKRGYCRVLYANGKHQDFKRNEFEPLCAAARAGVEQWYEAEDLYGDPCLIRISEIAGVAECSPAALAAFEAEEAERVEHEKLHGRDDE